MVQCTNAHSYEQTELPFLLRRFGSCLSEAPIVHAHWPRRIFIVSKWRIESNPSHAAHHIFPHQPGAEVFHPDILPDTLPIRASHMEIFLDETSTGTVDEDGVPELHFLFK